MPLLLLVGCADPVELRLGPEHLDLGSVPVGGGSVGRVELMLVSSGPASLSLGIEPEDAPFRVLDRPTGGLAQGEHYFVHVEFAPHSAGQHAAALVVEVDAGDARRRVDLELRGEAAALRVDRDRDGWVAGPDCDDDDPRVHPGAPESCDGRDEDCDGAPDDDEADVDGDGLAPCEGDCDDGDGDVWPAAPEICDGADSNCDGALPAEELDLDGDGFPPCAGDCADLDPDRSPGQPEFCDGFDTDCDGVLFAEEQDGDGDGVFPCEGDCDDGAPTRGPGFVELCNAVDDDCDGALPADESDVDGDGFYACDSDCDDGNPAVHDNMDEAFNGIDDDCDGAPLPDEVDLDGDGFLGCAECDDGDPSLFPGGVELCDGLDGDCSGAPGVGEVDVDSDGFLACAECDDADPEAFPGAPELCDGDDQDCDGLPGPGEHDLDGDGFLACDDCDDFSPTSYPNAAEICDRLDNDCDGGLPQDEQDVDADGSAECEGDCDDTDPALSPAEAEDCFDEVDQNCDGAVNEGCSCPAWVAPTAPPSCSTAGTYECPYAAVQDAVDALEFELCEDVWIQPGTYVENLVVSAATALLGRGPRADVVLDGGGVGTVLQNLGSSLRLESLTIADGLGEVGGVDSATGALEAVDVAFVDNDCGAVGEVGALRHFGTTLVLSSSSFVGNRCTTLQSNSGGVAGFAQSVLVEGSTFEGNVGSWTSALLGSAAAYGPTTLRQNTFVGNSSLDMGYPDDGTPSTVLVAYTGYVVNNLFAGNLAEVGTGGLRLVEAGATTVVANNVLVENAGVAGGALHLETGLVAAGTIQNNIVADNSPFGFYVDGPGYPTQTRFNDAWGNGTDWGSSGPLFVPPDNASFDPGFVAWSADGDLGNDDFALQIGSLALDAGNPAPAWDDPDGSANDLGLFGGPFGDWTGP